MGYTIKDLFESDKFPEMQLISGHSGINREIRGIRIIEVPDMERFLSVCGGGRELLLTTMRAYQKINEQEFLMHLEKLEKKQIAGFVVKRNQTTEQQKKLFDILLQFAQEHQLPVIEIPQHIYFWDLIKYVLMQICDKETAKLAYFKMTHDNLSSILLHTFDTKKLIDRVLFVVETMIGNPIALYDDDFVCLHASSPNISAFVMEKDIEEYTPDIITKSNYLRQKRENTEYIKKLDIFGQRKIYLVISEKREPLTVLDFIALESIFVMLQYIIMRNTIEADIAKKYRGDLEYRLLNGSLSGVEEDEVAELLELEETDELQVITCRLIPKNNTGNFTDEQRRELAIVEKEILKFLPQDYVSSNTNQLIYIHKENEKEGKLEFRKRVEKVQQRIQKYLVKKGVNLDFLVGIGNSVTGYHHLKESFEDSKMALGYINVIRKIVGDKDKAVVDCSKLGIFYALIKMHDKETLWTYIPDSLRRLYQNDVRKNGELIDTLECFLNNNQSLKKTSQQMYIHYRTVSYRLQKITEISGMDFENAAEMLVVRNGLIVLRIIEEM